MELILDASSDSAMVGLAQQGTLIWESGSLEAQQHTRQLLPTIQRALCETSMSLEGLKLVVVALGPGPFNGLRVAVATAKGIAAGTEVSLVGIATMRAEAYRCPPALGTVRPILRAGRSGYSTTLFKWQDLSWQQVEDVSYIDSASLETITDGSVPLCGLWPPCTPESDAQDARPSRLQSLAAIGWQDFQVGNTVTAAALQPIYLRPPHITTPRDRRP